MADKLKIVAFGARGFPDVQGGLERYAQEMLPLLSHRGFQVTALTITRFSKSGSWNGIKILGLPSPPLMNFEKPFYNFLATVYCIFARPDIVFLMGLNAGLFIWLLKIAKLKVVARYSSRDYLYPKWGKLAKIVWRIAEKQFKLVDCVIVNSKQYINLLSETIGCKNVVYIPNGICSSSFDFVDSHFKNKLNSWSLSNKKYILAVGRITPEKKFHTLIEAFKLLKICGLKLVIAGSHDHNKTYFNKLLNMSNDNIIFTGQVSTADLALLYRHTSLFVMPSAFEGMPNALLEAMMHNCQILVSDIEAHRSIELLDDNDFFPVDDLLILQSKIEEKLRTTKVCDYRCMLENGFLWDCLADDTAAAMKACIADYNIPSNKIEAS